MLVAEGGEHLRHGLPFGGEGAAVVGFHIDNLSYVVLCCQGGMVRLASIFGSLPMAATIGRIAIGHNQSVTVSLKQTSEEQLRCEAGQVVY